MMGSGVTEHLVCLVVLVGSFSVSLSFSHAVFFPFFSVATLWQMMLTPAMQGVILAIAKAREVYDKDGPEAALIKVFRFTVACIHL